MAGSCSRFQIIKVTNPSEVPALAELCVLALQPDPFFAFMERYSGSLYEGTVRKLSAAVEDPCSKVFKAIKPERNAEGVIEAKLVGLSQWYVGYCVVPKVDPFVPEAEQKKDDRLPKGSMFATRDMGGVPLPPPASVDDEKGRAAVEELMRKSGNAYISAIRGKRHVYLRRMIVHPEYQKQGIGTMLVKWGMDVADEGKIVGWLYSRPAGQKLYEREGFKVVDEVEVNGEGLECEVPVMTCMLRLPKVRN